MKAALQHSARFPAPVRMVFVEQRQDRFQNLSRVLSPYLEQARRSQKLLADQPLHGDCDTVLKQLLDDSAAKGVGFGPALAFFDQFGYGAVPMSLIGRILRFDMCEVFTYLEYKSMNRWITDPSKAVTFTSAFGGEEWRECINLPEAKRRSRLLDLYKNALNDRKRGNSKYVVSFLMYDANRQPLYWLIFCTNNLRGLEEMKKAMWTVDRTGNFRFSDADNPNQLTLLDECCSPAWLAEELRAKLIGREMTIWQIKEFVLTNTPCYLFKEALKILETGERQRLRVLKAPAGRRRGDYKDDDLSEIVARFENPVTFESMELFS